MKHYDNSSHQLVFIWDLKGSVFVPAFIFAFPATVLAVVFCLILDATDTDKDHPSLAINSSAYTGFTFLVGFLLVFRTSQAYGRFYAGAQHLGEMSQRWRDATGSLISFSHENRRDGSEKKLLAEQDDFRHVLIRLVSMLHCVALEEVAVMAEEDFEVIDVRGLNPNSVSHLHSFPEHSRSDLVMQWILRLVVDNIRTGVLVAPPPVLGRALNELSNGMFARRRAMVLAFTPFPFPYAQMTTVLLLVHWLFTPVMMCLWTGNLVFAACFTFISVFGFWCIQYIAVEIEQPFGDDVNDLPIKEMQNDMNHGLLCLIDPVTHSLPTLTESAVHDLDALRSAHVIQKKADEVIGAPETLPSSEGNQGSGSVHVWSSLGVNLSYQWRTT